ncbi:MAG: hypothetical protein ABIK56_01935, partial [candidate division WOR-3 bacterium]
MVIFFFLLFNQIEESYNYLQEEILFLKENPISKIKDIEIVPYLDDLPVLAFILSTKVEGLSGILRITTTSLLFSQFLSNVPFTK